MAEFESGFTQTQRELLDLLWDTKVEGKAGRRTFDESGWEQLEAKGFKVYAPLPVSQVFEYYFRTNRIDQAKYEECMNYLNDARLKSGLPKLELATA